MKIAEQPIAFRDFFRDCEVRNDWRVDTVTYCSDYAIHYYRIFLNKMTECTTQQCFRDVDREYGPGQYYTQHDTA